MIIMIIQQPGPFRSCVHRMHVLADRNYGKHFCSNASLLFQPRKTFSAYLNLNNKNADHFYLTACLAELLSDMKLPTVYEIDTRSRHLIPKTSSLWRWLISSIHVNNKFCLNFDDKIISKVSSKLTKNCFIFKNSPEPMAEEPK